MEIRHVSNNKKRYLDLLLVGDEEEKMIDRYLDRGELFALYDNEEVVAVCVVTNEGSNIYELKNVAVEPKLQKRGYGTALVKFVLDWYKDRAVRMIVGTGDSDKTLAFYKSLGFTPYRKVKNFFVDNYAKPIYEGTRQLVDMIYLKMELS